ncbi:MAG: LarC family nickel insertion protein [Oscillospiraceae bacterium]|nr:LarC family nickel insertion protein [Oscillospiraceae bacterium]
MKTIYLDCSMGAAGDMLMAALLELHPRRDAFLEKINALGIPEVRVTAEPSVKCGITGTHVSVSVGGVEEESLDVHGHTHEHHGHEKNHAHSHDHGHNEAHDHNDCEHHSHAHDHTHSHEPGHSHPHNHNEGHSHGHAHTHHHAGIKDIKALIQALPVSKKVQEDIVAVYNLIAEAEGHVHGRPVEDVHFHEVGTMDALADIAGVCMLMEELAPEKILASAVHVGSGQVRCAHGILPVPAPATAHILRGVPIYGGSVRGELCTPTGAALLKHYVSVFGDMPVMTVSDIGYGMGKKDFEAANCVRASLGETAE